MLSITNASRKWWILTAMGFSLAVVVLDETIVGVALPSIAAELNMKMVTAHWVINAYMLVFTGLAAAGGKLLDRVNIKILFTAGIMVFGLASFGCGSAESATQLIITRSIQGIGASIIFPASAALIAMVFAPQHRGLALGVYTSFGSVFMALGPLLGGIFSETFSWRWIFWVNLPVLALIIWILQVAWIKLPGKQKASRVDYFGLITFIIALLSIVLGIMQGNDWHWNSLATFSLIGGGIVIMLCFLLVELQISNPFFELRLFQNGLFTSGNLIIWMGEFNKVTIIIFVASYLQNELLMSPIRAGFSLLPAMLPLLFSPILSGRLADKYGPRLPMLMGLSMNALAIAWIALAIPMKNYSLMIPALLIWGLSLPFNYVPTRRAVLDAVPADKKGQVSGISMTAQLLGGTIGIAACSALLSITNNYQNIFLMATGISLVVILFSYRYSHSISS